MTAWGRVRGDVRTVALSLVSHVVLVLLTAAFLAVAALFAKAWHGHGLSATLTLPAWLLLLVALIGLVSAVVAFVNGRRASVVRGREDATKVNVALLASRDSLPEQDRLVLSTRFGNWPPTEDLPNRRNFRKELDKAILNETTQVDRIWNVSSPDDAVRLREMIARYRGRPNHHIRAYFEIPDHVMPELLVVDRRGASISFTSMSRQQSLDRVILFKRHDLAHVIRNYFGVLWEHAERILQGGELTPEGDRRLSEFEQKFATRKTTP